MRKAGLLCGASASRKALIRRPASRTRAPTLRPSGERLGNRRWTPPIHFTRASAQMTTSLPVLSSGKAV
jgi:hypothetical protein